MIDKDVNYYLSLPYPILLTPMEEGGWFAEIPLLKGCWSDGETPDQAVQNLREAQTGWLEVSLKHHHRIPEPEPMKV